MNYNKNINKIKENMTQIKLSPETAGLPDLSKTVLDGLDFFSGQNRPPRLKLKKPGLIFVVGSVNAHHTGRLLFSQQAALFADESNFNDLLKIYRPLIKKKTIKEAIIISASGEKDSVWEIKAAKKAGLKTSLLTCRADSTAARLADLCHVFNKFPEPYSYNFSTYLGMLLSLSGENPVLIKKYLQKIKKPTNFSRYHYYSFILPDRFRPLADMLNVKDDELFGPYSSLRAYSEGQARHAKFIVSSPQELVISFGPNPYFGLVKNRWEIKLPPRTDFALILSLAYYLTGLIQSSQPPYFKKGLPAYCRQTGPLPYKQKKPFPLIVE